LYVAQNVLLTSAKLRHYLPVYLAKGCCLVSLFSRSANSKIYLFSAVLFAACASPAIGQVAAGVHTHAGAAGAHVGASAAVGGAGVGAGAGVQAGVRAPVGAAAGVQAGAQSDRLDRDTLYRRAGTIAVAGAGASYVAGKVSGMAKSTVDLGKVKSVPHWGPAAASVPVFGKMAAGGSVVPTTLGQVPVLGYAVKRVPLVGPVVAGPANPVLVGAVAVDNYVLPKYSPCGYTKSSVVAATNDFNSPPKLRHYVNYLAPLPYTHPPIYSPSTLETDLPADMAYIDAIPAHTLSDAVNVPDL
jgi:hypothetical protein